MSCNQSDISMLQLLYSPVSFITHAIYVIPAIIILIAHNKIISTKCGAKSTLNRDILQSVNSKSEAPSLRL